MAKKIRQFLLFAALLLAALFIDTASERTFPSPAALAETATELPATPSPDSHSYLHHDAIPAMACQLHDSQPPSARAQLRQHSAPVNAVRENILKKHSQKRYSSQKQKFMVSNARLIADGGFTFRRGVLLS